MRSPLRRHDVSSRTRYHDTVQAARTQAHVLPGTPGTLKKRTQAGNQYWVREHIRIDGAKVDDYHGAVASVPKSALEALQAEVALARDLASRSAALRLIGFQRIEKKPAAVLAVFFNRGLFGAGLTLIGSHAYGVLLNELGIIAPAYRTQDLDVARAQALEIALPEGESFGSLLNDSGLRFVPVPGLPSRVPSASYKLPGAADLLVDLLVPGAQAGKVVPVSELSSHAQTVPLLDFLVAERLDAAALSPNQVIPVSVPAPERFVLHKLYASQSRRTDPGKAAKDIEQAATVGAGLEDEFPEKLLTAWKRFPPAGRPAVRKAAQALLRRTKLPAEATAVFERIAR